MLAWLKAGGIALGVMVFVVVGVFTAGILTAIAPFAIGFIVLTLIVYVAITDEESGKPPQ